MVKLTGFVHRPVQGVFPEAAFTVMTTSSLADRALSLAVRRSSSIVLEWGESHRSLYFNDRIAHAFRGGAVDHAGLPPCFMGVEPHGSERLRQPVIYPLVEHDVVALQALDQSRRLGYAGRRKRHCAQPAERPARVRNDARGKRRTTARLPLRLAEGLREAHRIARAQSRLVPLAELPQVKQRLGPRPARTVEKVAQERVDLPRRVFGRIPDGALDSLVLEDRALDLGVAAPSRAAERELVGDEVRFVESEGEEIGIEELAVDLAAPDEAGPMKFP